MTHETLSAPACTTHRMSPLTVKCCLTYAFRRPIRSDVAAVSEVAAGFFRGPKDGTLDLGERKQRKFKHSSGTLDDRCCDP